MSPRRRHRADPLASTRSARAQALLYEVNTTSDTVVVGACAKGLGGCSLRGAMQVVNRHPGSDAHGARNTGGNHRILNVATSGTVTLSKMTISNGRLDPGNGRCIANQNAGTITVSNCTLSGNLVNSTNSGGRHRRI